MTRKLIRKQDLTALLQSLRRADVACYAPLSRSGGLEFDEVGPKDEIVFDYRNTELPPKRFFRPACQETAVIEKDELKEAPADFSAAVLFGVRPCDAASFALLDKVFLEGDYADNFYQARREATTVVALACDSVGDTCFCGALGSSPTSSAEADVLAFDLGQNLLLEAHSPKGEALLAAHASCFAEPGESDLTERDKRAEAVKGAAAGAVLPGKDKLLAVFHSSAWERVSETCLECNVCAYFCPTCHCFALADEMRRGQGRRLRVEDSCLNRQFTAEASGHNPRPTARERMRQRIMHKFAYAVDLYGETLCVGCGRCVAHCPVNIDVRETLCKVCE
jgi:sulfhydrogenase subunit beta (sulfur reductase)